MSQQQLLVELEQRERDLKETIESLRQQQDKPDFHAIRDEWRKTWLDTFAKLRATQRRIAELTPLTPDEVRELAQAALEQKAHDWTALGEHGNGTAAYRTANALRNVAAIFADDGTSPYRFVPVGE